MRYLQSQRGVTLIEVLMAVLVFSVGVLGAASLLLVSARANQSAYLRTQVTFLAQGMADRMLANPIGVWSGYYNATYPNGSRADCAGGCTPRQLATYDQAAWGRQLGAFLPPGASAEIACHHAGVPYAPTPGQVPLRPPYGGRCSMTITWREQGIGLPGASSDGGMQTFAWEFQP